MEIRVPHYYRKFKCTADKCPDTCCAGWQIVIDEETLEKYHKFEVLLAIVWQTPLTGERVYLSSMRISAVHF